MRILAALAAAAGMAYPAVACGQDALEMEGDEAASPLDFQAVYTGEIWRNEGGLADGWRYLDNLDLTLSADLDQTIGLQNTRASAYVLYNNGKSLNELTGDALVASNIETGVRALRLYEAWIEHDFAPGASLRAGLYDLNSEFDALETSSLFLGSAHGIGADLSQSGENGPSIFPVTSLAARLSVEVSDRLILRTAVLDAVPGDPARPARTTIRLGDGALTIIEADWRSGGTRVLAGAWGYTDSLARIDGPGMAKSFGAYLRAEACLVRDAACMLSGFVRVGAASEATNPFDAFASAGLAMGLGERASLGVAVAHATGDDRPGRDPALHLSETAYEATLAWRVTERVSVQPNFQYITSRVGPANADARVFGVRVSFAAF